MISKVIDINDNQPHKVSEVICVNCKHRWIAVRLLSTKLKQLVCPHCGEQGFTIETGEEFEEADLHVDLKKL